jgi:lipoic acid synthetase
MADACSAWRLATPRPRSSASRSGSARRRRWGRNTPRSTRLVKSRGPAHGVPGGGLPQHLRVLGGPRGHLPHRRRQCTRRCDFCQIDTGKPPALDRDEPRRVAESVQKMGLRTPPSPGSRATTCPTVAPGSTPRRSAQIHELNPGTGVENLPPTSTRAAPPARGLRVPSRGARAQRRDRAAHLQAHPSGVPLRASLDVITQARDFGLVTKSNLILGMGETREEVSQAFATCTRRAATSSPSPSTSAPRCAPPDRAVGQARGVRGAQGRRPTRSGSPA